MNKTTNEFRTVSGFEIDKTKLETIVRFDDRSNYFDFYSDGRIVYSIELERITQDSIIKWVKHLCGKIWVNREHIHQFLQLASNHSNINIHGSL
jgi:hypothetical protein